MNIKSINKLSALIGVICGLTLLPLTVTAQGQENWTNPGTGAWEDAANWQGGEVPPPSTNINIANGGEAQFTAATTFYYINKYMGYGFNSVVIDGNSTLTVTSGGVLNTGTLSLQNNSTVNMDAATWSEVYIQEVTGDNTGTFNLTGNGSGMNNYVTYDSVNIRSEVTGYVIVDALAGTGNHLTVVSGTLAIEDQDNRVGGNTTVANGASLEIRNNNIMIQVQDGYSLSGGGTVKFNGSSLISIGNGGRLNSSVTIDNGNNSGAPWLVLEDGAILEFAKNSPLIILGTSFEIAAWNSTVFVDFSDASLVGETDYVIIDWTGVTNMKDGTFSAANFSAAGTDVTGEFSIRDSQLVFTTDAVPEPSTYFLLGAGLGMLSLAAHYRRRNVQS
jgi:hypothetical protein